MTSNMIENKKQSKIGQEGFEIDAMTHRYKKCKDYKTTDSTNKCYKCQC